MQDAVATNPLQAERDLIRKQEYVMKQQDLALQDIEQGVGRLKNKVDAAFPLLRFCALIALCNDDMYRVRRWRSARR